jgi:four helix bundle protein
MFRFERLEVWKLAVEFAEQVYLCTRSFPSDERFGLTNQLRRAAVSISSNIAEGSGRLSPKDFVRFLSIAYGSLMECVSQLHIAHRLKYIEPEPLADLRMLAESIARMLSRLKTSLEGKDVGG